MDRHAAVFQDGLEAWETARVCMLSVQC